MPQWEERFFRGDSCTRSSLIGWPVLRIYSAEVSQIASAFHLRLTNPGPGRQGLPLSTRRRQVSLRGEWVNMALLVVLYAMQGVPLGLTLGSM